MGERNKGGGAENTDSETPFGMVGSAALDSPVIDSPGMSREQRRSRRKRVVRARTISIKRMTKRELEMGRVLYPETEYWKPRSREECAESVRPCPYVSCKHHLFTDVSPKTGAIKVNFPDLEVWELTESCALDVADRGGTTLEDVGAIMNLTRERIRQVEVKALAKLKALNEMTSIRELVDEGPIGKRRLPVLSNDELSDVRGAKPERNDDGEPEAKKPTDKSWQTQPLGYFPEDSEEPEATEVNDYDAVADLESAVESEVSAGPESGATDEELELGSSLHEHDLAVDF